MIWIYDTVYYTCATLFAFFIFRNEKWFPTEIDGTDFKELYMIFPTFQRYKLNISILLESLSSHLLYGTKIELKYWEYLLHHSLTVSLLYFSTMYNCENIGIIVLLLHDISDIFLALGRTYGDLGKTKILVYF